MKNFAVLWDELDQDGEKPASSEWRNEDIALYTYFARKHGLKLYHAHYSQFSEGKLGKAWFYNGKTWEKREDVEIRGVYDKFVMNENTKDLRREIEDQVLLINALELQEIAADKLKTYQNLKEHSKETRKASEENVRKMLDENRRVLIKPRYGSGGEGIEVIEDVSEYKPSQDVEELVQAFIEPGSLPEFGVEGPHDLRMFMINGEIRSCYIRLPDEGLLSNVNLGGRTEYVDVDEIPEKAVEKAKAIDRGLEHISPRIYSIDLMKGESGDFWLVELNDKPAVYCFKPACDMNVEFENIERMFEVMSKAMD